MTAELMANMTKIGNSILREWRETVKNRNRENGSEIVDTERACFDRRS